jgi:hypothetical protein
MDPLIVLRAEAPADRFARLLRREFALRLPQFLHNSIQQRLLLYSPNNTYTLSETDS